MIYRLCALLLICVPLVLQADAKKKSHDLPSCVDEDGNTVDWYIVYNYPAMSDKSARAKFRSGFAYAYITSDTVSEKKTKRSRSRKKRTGDTPESLPSDWIVSDKLLTDPDSMIMRTLEIAYDSKYESAQLNTIFYNDNPEKSTPKSSRAHAKGLLVVDDDSGDGFWMTHSVPQFPPERTEKLQFNDNARKYGQTFMCINIDWDTAGEQITNHLLVIKPQIYDSYISEKLFQHAPDLTYLKRENSPHGGPKKVMGANLTQKIETRDGQPMYLFAKSNTFTQDMYSSWINQELGATLYVETWRAGVGNPLSSNCSAEEYHVNNVQQLQSLEAGEKIKWSYTQDHSKWAISDEDNPGFVCLSDINRMESQYKRGGGAFCMLCPNCWTAFSSTIKEVEGCPAYNE